jgi:hypothetical protein
MAYPYPQISPRHRRIFIGMSDRWRGLAASNPYGRGSRVSSNASGTGIKHSHGPLPWDIFWPSGTRGTFRRAVSR